MKRIFWKVLPYFVSICAGLAFLGIAGSVKGKLEILFIHLSAVFFAISLIFLFYELIRDVSHKKLNKEIFEYAKMQIDYQVWSIIGQVSKMVYSYQQKPNAGENIGKLPSMSKEETKGLVSKNHYLGFQIYKNWDATLNQLHEILGNSFMTRRLDDDQVVCIISMTKSLRALEDMRVGNNAFVMTGKTAKDYKIVSGREMSSHNVDLPDRLLLLRDVGQGKFVVTDFGDFHLYDKNKLLKIFGVNEAALDPYAERIFRIISCVNKWIRMTGSKLIFR